MNLILFICSNLLNQITKYAWITHRDRIVWYFLRVIKVTEKIYFIKPSYSTFHEEKTYNL